MGNYLWGSFVTYNLYRRGQNLREVSSMWWKQQEKYLSDHRAQPTALPKPPSTALSFPLSIYEQYSKLAFNLNYHAPCHPSKYTSSSQTINFLLAIFLQCQFLFLGSLNISQSCCPSYITFLTEKDFPSRIFVQFRRDYSSSSVGVVSSVVSPILKMGFFPNALS